MVATSHPRSVDDGHDAHGSRAAAGVPSTLDELLALDAPALARLYRDASVPELRDLDGDLRGRMLVGPFGKGLSSFMRAASRMRGFPWLGKTFRSLGDGHGEGVNRVVTN